MEHSVFPASPNGNFYIDFFYFRYILVHNHQYLDSVIYMYEITICKTQLAKNVWCALAPWSGFYLCLRCNLNCKPCSFSPFLNFRTERVWLICRSKSEKECQKKGLGPLNYAMLLMLIPVFDVFNTGFDNKGNKITVCNQFRFCIRLQLHLTHQRPKYFFVHSNE